MSMTPAYGRDYKSAKEAQESWERGDDWILNDISSLFSGKYCSGRDFPYESVKLRYGKLQKVTFAVYYPAEATRHDVD